MKLHLLRVYFLLFDSGCAGTILQLQLMTRKVGKLCFLSASCKPFNLAKAVDKFIWMSLNLRAQVSINTWII
ncbi:hypothetical protein O6H91_Y324000 [Diphasiastrum complanatum]|nr:hypothetical protein O6H91_Y324000 [Diphasiastrum complanatum]